MSFLTNTVNGTGVRTLRVRALLAIILTIGATVGFFMGTIPYDAYMPLVSMCLGYFFGSATTASDAPKEVSPTPKP